ncbi:MAG: hypothetical protein AAF747_04575 [Planctomycetota bacterium]
MSRNWTAFALVTTVSATNAQVFFAQAPDTDRLGVGFISASVTGQLTEQSIADDFTPVRSGNATGISWFGNSENFAVADLSNFATFTITFYEDDAGLPGAVIQTESFAASSLTTSVVAIADTVSIGAEVTEITATLSAPLSLTQGDTYWVEIGAANVQRFGDAFSWHVAETTAGNGFAFNLLDGNGFQSSTAENVTDNLAFTIIPTPGVGAVVAFAGLGFATRRR